MAGIGFVLQKLFEKDTFVNRAKAYAYSAIAAAGPWIAAVVTLNIMLFLTTRYYFVEPSERFLFMGTVVYSFIFSQIITAPWQFIATRYIADKLYHRDYAYIKPTFTGLSKIIFAISFVIAVVFYYDKGLPLYYKYMAASLFILLSLVWVVMVFLSASKNYTVIASAFIFGGMLSLVLLFVLMRDPIPFKEFTYAGNMLFAYLVGVIITFIILLYSFFDTFHLGNRMEYDFLRYLNKVPSLFFIGLFYTMGLWIDNILMWYSPHGITIYGVYRSAPLYDYAVFLAFLTIIPTMVLFLVFVETKFYAKYKKYYKLISEKGTYKEIVTARDEMRSMIYKQIIYIMEYQILFTLTLIVLSGVIFPYLGLPMLVAEIFRITALGTLCNAVMLVVLLILLYFEAKKYALVISATFFLSNFGLTLYFIPKGVEFYGFGYFIASLISLTVALVLLFACFRKINYATFMRQPAFFIEDKGIFVDIADMLSTRSR